MSEVNVFPVTINKIKGVDVVQTQKWGTVWNNPPGIDFGQIMGNLKLVDYFSVLSKEKRESAFLPALVADSKSWRWEKPLLSIFEYVQLFSSTGNDFAYVPTGSFWHAKGHRTHRGWCPCMLPPSHLSFLPLLTSRLKPSPLLSHRDLDHSFTSEMFSNVHLFLIY